MFKHLIAFTGVLLFVSVLPGKAQNLTPNDTVSKEVVIVDGQQLNEKQLQRYYRQLRKDSIRAHKKIWWSVLGGPSYTPEASLGVGGAVLASFRMNKNDTISQRSFLPAGINLSINGTIVVAGVGTFFFNQNKFRIYASYGYRNEPAHYYGKGYETIEHVDRSDSTTRYHRSYFQIYPRFVWEVRPHFRYQLYKCIGYKSGDGARLLFQSVQTKIPKRGNRRLDSIRHKKRCRHPHKRRFVKREYESIRKISRRCL